MQQKEKCRKKVWKKRVEFEEGKKNLSLKGFFLLLKKTTFIGNAVSSCQDAFDDRSHPLGDLIETEICGMNTVNGAFVGIGSVKRCAIKEMDVLIAHFSAVFQLRHVNGGVTETFFIVFRTLPKLCKERQF